MEPRPGDYFVIRSGGFVSAAIRLLTRSGVNHSGVYIGNGFTVESEAAGAVSKRLRPGMVFSNGMPLSDGDRAAICLRARELLGTPYSYLDIVALALSSLGLRWRWLEARVTRQDRMVCSQLVDTAFARAGVQLFDDGRLPQNVTPGDLADVLLRRPWEGPITLNGKVIH